MKKSISGFTVVELLIVIVVIAILAAISVVAYRGIQNNANDAAVMTDLANFARQIQLMHAESGEYPDGTRTIVSPGNESGSYHDSPGFTFKPSRAAYASLGRGALGLAYCRGVSATSGEPAFAIIAQSRSGQALRYVSSNGGVESLGSVGLTLARACNGLNHPHTVSYGYTGNNGWID